MMRKALTGAVVAASLASMTAQAGAGFQLTSPAMVEGGPLPAEQVLDGFGCAGANRSPALGWTAPPAGTRSLAVTLCDPDAPTGSGWWHWVLFNLPPDLRTLAEGAAAGTLPARAVQGRNDFGLAGYGGACPPAGEAPHRYVLTLWALDVPDLPLDAGAGGAMVGFFLNRHALAKASLTARYGR